MSSKSTECQLVMNVGEKCNSSYMSLHQVLERFCLNLEHRHTLFGNFWAVGLSWCVFNLSRKLIYSFNNFESHPSAAFFFFRFIGLLIFCFRELGGRAGGGCTSGFSTVTFSSRTGDKSSVQLPKSARVTNCLESQQLSPWDLSNSGACISSFGSTGIRLKSSSQRPSSSNRIRSLSENLLFFSFSSLVILLMLEGGLLLDGESLLFSIFLYLLC